MWCLWQYEVCYHLIMMLSQPWSSHQLQPFLWNRLICVYCEFYMHLYSAGQYGLTFFAKFIRYEGCITVGGIYIDIWICAIMLLSHHGEPWSNHRLQRINAPKSLFWLLTTMSHFCRSNQSLPFDICWIWWRWWSREWWCWWRLKALFAGADLINPL